MTPILNGNLSIHAIRLKLKKDPFPSKLCSHIPSKMDPSRPPGPSLATGRGALPTKREGGGWQVNFYSYVKGRADFLAMLEEELGTQYILR